MANRAYNIKWKKQETHFQTVLSNYLNKQTLSDILLTAEGKIFKAHQLVLCACSPYFESICLEVPPNSYPVIFLRDVSAQEIKLLLDYIYKGETRVPSELMDGFLKTCQLLQIQDISVAEEPNLSSEDDFHSAVNTQQNDPTRDTVDEVEDLLTSIFGGSPKRNEANNNTKSNSPDSFVFQIGNTSNSEPMIVEAVDEVITVPEESQEIVNDTDCNEINIEEHNIDDERLSESQLEQEIQRTDISLVEHEICTDNQSEIDEEIQLRLSSSSESICAELSDESEIITKSRTAPNRNEIMKTDAMEKGQHLKVIVNRMVIKNGQDKTESEKLCNSNDNTDEILNTESVCGTSTSRSENLLLKTRNRAKARHLSESHDDDNEMIRDDSPGISSSPSEDSPLQTGRRKRVVHLSDSDSETFLDETLTTDNLRDKSTSNSENVSLKTRNRAKARRLSETNNDGNETLTTENLRPKKRHKTRVRSLSESDNEMIFDETVSRENLPGRSNSRSDNLPLETRNKAKARHLSMSDETLTTATVPGNVGSRTSRKRSNNVLTDDVYLTEVLKSTSDIPLEYRTLYCPNCKRCVRRDALKKHFHQHSVARGLEWRKMKRDKMK